MPAIRHAAGAALLAVLLQPSSVRVIAREPAAPRVFLLDPDRLLAAKDAIRRQDAAVMPAWAALRIDADAALTASRFSIVDKAVTPPSGDKHDYTSQAPYFWRNPATASGLPYIRRDGERNPELDRITDHRSLDGLTSSVPTLALACWLSGDERYAAKAAQLLRAWFIDPATRMNPNLEYAQFIPGVNTGRGIGLIETRGLTRIVDAVGLLEASPSWHPDDDRAVKDWFARYLAWMQESRNGRDEAAAKNNHGTYYDLQLTSFALFLDRPALARGILEQAQQKRIAAQIERDGRQPLELARTKAWSYSVGNLDGLTQLATLGERAGVDLWHFETPDGRSIRKAIDYLAPFALGHDTWPHQQLGGFSPQALFPVLRRAAAHYGDAAFRKVVSGVPPAAGTDRSRLFAVVR